MRPCEQCVYIRFAFVMIGIYAFILCLKLNKFIRAIFFIFGIWGTIYGIFAALKLRKIHQALNDENVIFGFGGCSLEHNFPLNLPLDKLSLFQPTGECGFDAPQPPFDANLDAIQRFFVDLYSDGWYLIPKIKFMDMATCSLIIFGCFLVIFVIAFINEIINFAKNYKF